MIFWSIDHFNFVDIQGVVYVKCSNAEVAASASKALHGRWFAGEFVYGSVVNTTTLPFSFRSSIP